MKRARRASDDCYRCLLSLSRMAAFGPARRCRKPRRPTAKSEQSAASIAAIACAHVVAVAAWGGL